MSTKETAQSGGVGVFGLLGVLFVGLKLAHVINWSWWWVTAPFWGGLAVVVAVVLAFLLGAGIVLLTAAIVDLAAKAKR